MANKIVGINTSNILLPNDPKFWEELNKIPHRSFPGVKLEGEDCYKKLYHFTSFETFVLIWLKKRLKFSPRIGANDIKEINTSIDFGFHQPVLALAYEDVRAAYKQICFSMDYTTSIKGFMNPLLWGVYANKNKGVCIEIDFDKLNTTDTLHNPINYCACAPSNFLLPKTAKSINDIKNYFIENQEELLFTKEACWEHENEFRIVSDKLSYLDVTNAISAVYLTSFESLEFEMVKELLKGSDTALKIVYPHRTGYLLDGDPDIKIKEKQLSLSEKNLLLSAKL